MRAIANICLVALLVQASSGADLESLYGKQRWAELHDGLANSRGSDLYRGAVAVVFHENSRRAEKLLRSTIRTLPASDDAYQAYEWLSHKFLYEGRYHSFVAVMEARWAAFPGKAEQKQERAAVAGFRGLPDQVTESVRPSTVPHEQKSIFIPLSVNHSAATYFFDTGAWISCISESEAKRVGLRFTGVAGLADTMTSKAGYRTAVADELVVGGVSVKHVSFAVFPDNGEPWSLLPVGRRGLLGIPIILAFQTLRWEPAGSMRIGEKPSALDVRKANLIFDDDHLAVAVSIQGRKALAAVDTGAETSDFYRELAVQFPSVVETGEKGSTEIRGVGGAEAYESVTLPELTLDVGGRQTIVRPAHVLMNRGVRSYVGNLGMDVFHQGAAFRLDFRAMTLHMISGNTAVGGTGRVTCKNKTVKDTASGSTTVFDPVSTNNSAIASTLVQ